LVLALGGLNSFASSKGAEGWGGAGEELGLPVGEAIAPVKGTVKAKRELGFVRTTANLRRRGGEERRVDLTSERDVESERRKATRRLAELERMIAKQG
jgi:hypothetical protein